MHDVVELGLRKSDTVETVGSVVEGFLRVLAEGPPDADEKDLKTFVATIQRFREQVALCETDGEARRLAAAAARTCEQFLRTSRHYYAAREAELKDMIEILHSTAGRLAGDSSEFNCEMRATSERLRGVAQLDDIRELKRRLGDEASALHRIVESKQKRDEAALVALSEQVQTLKEHLQEAEVQVMLDPLTKIANRGTFDESLARMVQAAKSGKTLLSLAMLDIDHFKKINDTHGHPIGDRVLLCAAQWIAGAVRQTDVVARYGGEEFGAILAGADLQAAENRFRDVLQQIADRSFEYEADGVSRSVRFTVSCGVSQLTGSESAQDLVLRADQALYDAKRQGRNRVVARKRSKLGGLFG